MCNELLDQYYAGIESNADQIRAAFPDGKIPDDLRRAISSLVANAMAYSGEVGELNQRIGLETSGRTATQSAVNVHLRGTL